MVCINNNIYTCIFKFSFCYPIKGRWNNYKWASSSKLPHEDTDEDEDEDAFECPLCLYDEELRKNGSSRVVLVDTETGRLVKTLLRGGYSAANSLAILPGVGGGVLVAGTYTARGRDPSFTVWRY